MTKKNKKMPLQTLTGSKGKYQNNGKANNTTSKEIRVLHWIYDKTIQGLTCTTFESFNDNDDTLFTTRVSILCHRYNLEIPRKQVKNPNTGTYYNEYWLSDDDIDKVITILNKE
jgi:hypothetical protein